MRNSVLQLNVISAEKELFSGSISSLVAPGIAGKFGILPGHAPLISGLKKGVLEIGKEGQNETIEVEGGVIEVSNDVVTICVV